MTPAPKAFPQPSPKLRQLIDELLLEAAGSLSNPEFKSESRSVGSIERIRSAIGVPVKGWQNWANGTKNNGHTKTAHARYTRAFRRLLTGDMSGKIGGVFDRPHVLKNTDEVYRFLIADDGKKTKIKEALEFLDEFLLRLSVSGDLKLLPTSYQVGDILQPGFSSHTRQGANEARAPGATVSPSPSIYLGRQDDIASAHTRRLITAFRRLRDGGDILATPSLQTLNFEPGEVSSADEAHKQRLYGGQIEASYELSPLDYVLAGFAFERGVVKKISSSIENASQPFTSHAVVSWPFQGKSIVLAQVLKQLWAAQGLWTFWSLQGAGRDPEMPFNCADNSSSISRIFELFERNGALPRRVVFIFDASGRPHSEVQRIFRFHQMCRQYAVHENRAISIVISAKSKANTLPGAYVEELRLTESDEVALYDALTAKEPVIVRGSVPLAELLKKYSPELRHVKDDVQSLADFIIRHSHPRRRPLPGYWFSDLDQEKPPVQRAFPFIAVSQLLDLPLPQSISHSFAGLGDQTTELLSSISGRIARQDRTTGAKIDYEWDGYVLASPAQARSLLVRLEMLDERSLRDALLTIGSNSIERARDDFDDWLANDEEYFRHLLHRLAKRDFNRLDGLLNGPAQADEMYSNAAGIITLICKADANTMRCARWAGTLSTLPSCGDFGIENPGIDRDIYRLCCEVEKSKVVTSGTTKAIVPFMAAMETLCKKFRQSESVLYLAKSVQQTFNLEDAIELVDWDDPMRARRVNEVVHSYMKFREAYPAGDRKRVLRQLSAEFEAIEVSLSKAGIVLDAGNFLLRADYIGRVSTGTPDDLSRQARYLRRAQKLVSDDFRQQGLWRKMADQMISIFEKSHHRSVDEYDTPEPEKA